MNEKIFFLKGQYVAVRSKELAIISWAEETLPPYCEAVDHASDPYVFTCNFGVVEKPKGQFRKTVRLHLNTLARQYEYQDCLEYETEYNVLYRCHKDNVEVFYPTLDSYTIQDPAIICREYLYNSLPNEWTELHASAIAIDDGAIAFLGLRGAGKTSFCISLLSGTNKKPGVGFITNDRLWINQRGDVSENVIGSPSPIRVGYGTMARNKDLSAMLSLYRDGLFLKTNRLTEKRHEYSVREICSKLDCRIIPKSKLQGIVLLNCNASNQPSFVFEEIKLHDTNWIDYGIDSSHAYPDWIIDRVRPALNTSMEWMHGVRCYMAKYQGLDNVSADDMQMVLNMLYESN